MPRLLSPDELCEPLPPLLRVLRMLPEPMLPDELRLFMWWLPELLLELLLYMRSLLRFMLPELRLFMSDIRSDDDELPRYPLCELLRELSL